MKATLLTLVGFITIFLSTQTLAWPDEGSCQGGNCGPAACNPYETNCQCTDPACNRPWDTNCISRGECCEAFGNMGAR